MLDAEETPAGLLRRLRGMVEDGTVRIEIDMRRHEHIDSPVIVEADSNRWIYGSLLLCGAAFRLGGPVIGAGTAALCLALYFGAGRPHIRRKLSRRVHRSALADVELWRRLWKFGGIALLSASGGRCAAPKGSWMEFVRKSTQFP